MKYSALVLRKGNCRRAMELIVFCFAILCIGGVVTPCSAALKEWVADFTDSHNWSSPGNWNPPGVPQDGDDVMFHITEEVNSPHMEMHNDIVGLRVHTLFFCGTGINSPGWVLDGNELTLLKSVEPVNGPTNSCKGDFTFECPLKLGAPTKILIEWGSINIRGNIDLNGNNLQLTSYDKMIVSGQITGTGNVRATAWSSFDDVPEITFGGPLGNTFTGKLSLHFDGDITFDKQSGVVVNDALQIGNAPPESTVSPTCKLARPHQIGDNARVWIAGGGQLLLDGHTETIYSLSLTNYDGNSRPALVDTGGATLSVLTDIIAVNESTNVVPTIRGKLGLPGPETAAAKSSTPL